MDKRGAVGTEARPGGSGPSSAGSLVPFRARPDRRRLGVIGRPRTAAVLPVRAWVGSDGGTAGHGQAETRSDPETVAAGSRGTRTRLGRALAPRYPPRRRNGCALAGGSGTLESSVTAAASPFGGRRDRFRRCLLAGEAERGSQGNDEFGRAGIAPLRLDRHRAPNHSLGGAGRARRSPSGAVIVARNTAAGSRRCSACRSATRPAPPASETANRIVGRSRGEKLKGDARIGEDRSRRGQTRMRSGFRSGRRARLC